MFTGVSFLDHNQIINRVQKEKKDPETRKLHIDTIKKRLRKFVDKDVNKVERTIISTRPISLSLLKQ